MTLRKPDRQHSPRGLAALTVVMLAVAIAAAPAEAVTKSEVEAACADSAAAYQTLPPLKASSQPLPQLSKKPVSNWKRPNTANSECAASTRTVSPTKRNSGRMSSPKPPKCTCRAGGTTIMLFSTPVEALTAFEFLNQSAADNLETVNDLAAISSELDRLRSDLVVAVDDLTKLRDLRQTTAANQETAMTVALGAYDQLSSRCKEVQAVYQAEQARIREEELRRSQDQAAGGPTRTIDGIRCPFTPAR